MAGSNGAGCLPAAAITEPAKKAASQVEDDLLHVLRREVLNTGAAGTMAADGLMVVIGQLRRSG